MAYGFPENGHLPSSSHLRHPWRIHEIVPDFRLEDVWALPVEGDADEFSDLLELVGSLRPGEDSAAARFLWQLRDRLGAWFGIGRISTAAGDAQPASPPPVPGTGEPSLAGRVPADLRDTTAGFDFGTLPFTPLYRTADEAAAEISNQTVYGVAHLGWAEQEDGRYQGRMAVYVKPRGLLGQAYMELIKPFRYLVVYPALMRQLEREWEERPARLKVP
jgi:Protein of unknown function (DUF2867)